MRILLSAVLSAALASHAVAQSQSVGPVLTLEQAIQVTLRNNPTHLQVQSQRGRAGAALRSSYGRLLPTVNSSFGTSFREGGSTVIEGQQFGSSSDQLGSSYSLSVNASYSLGSIIGPRQAGANLDAAEASLTSSEFARRSEVVQQYLNVLQAQARAGLQDTLVANAQAQVELNRARQQVGAATILDVRRAEVTLGQAQVNRLRERNSVDIETLRLFQIMGVDKPDSVRLTSQFPITEPTLQLNELLDMARRQNPALNAARSRETAAGVGVTAARSQFLPTLSFSTGLQGFTQKQTNIDPQIAQAQAQGLAGRRGCLTQDSVRTGAGLAAIGNCDRFMLTETQINEFRAQNDMYPFDFTKQPFGYSITLSLPIFDGFRREQAIENATLDRNDARYQVRAEELRVKGEVTAGHKTLATAYEAARIAQQNQEAAQQALLLAQERYRVGAGTFIEVTQARSDYETAATSYINAIYEFHKAYAVLEAAVGRPLR